MRAALSGLIALFLIGAAAAAQAPKGVGGSVNGAVVWVPDYYGQYVLIDTFDANGKLTAVTIPLGDEGRNVPDTDCGSTSGDQSATAGLVMEFLNGGLKGSHQSAPVNFKFSNWKNVTTSSPGFGGIFVQLK